MQITPKTNWYKPTDNDNDNDDDVLVASHTNKAECALQESVE